MPKLRATRTSPRSSSGCCDLAGSQDDREPPERLSLPESIGNVLRARLAMLPAEATDMLAQAAVLGQEFDLATLRALSGISWHALADMLNGAVQAWVLPI